MIAKFKCAKCGQEQIVRRDTRKYSINLSCCGSNFNLELVEYTDGLNEFNLKDVVKLTAKPTIK